MSAKEREALEPVYDPKDVPEGLSDEEQIRFWETHSMTEEFLEKTEEVPEDELPRPRTRPINVRFDEFTLGRLKALADSRNVGYQTLLKEFVVERLYEEEKREGMIAADRAGRSQVGDRDPGATERRQQAFESIAQESANVYSDFLNSALSFYQESLRSATQLAQNNLQTAGQVGQTASQVAQQSTEATNQAVQKNTETVRRAYKGS